MNRYLFIKFLYRIWEFFFQIFFRYNFFLKICNYFFVKKNLYHPNKQTFLCIGRDRFNDDIGVLLENKKRKFNYFILSNGFTRFQQAHVPKKFQEQTFYQSEITSSDISGLIHYADQTILPLLKYNLVGVISANFDYWQDHSFKIICKKYGLKFNVLSRENPVIPSVIDFVSSRYKRYNYKFQGNKIMVAGEVSKAVLIKSQISTSNSIISTGLPRFDKYLLSLNKMDTFNEKKLIVLFSFRQGYLFDNHFDNVLNDFVDLSVRYKKYNFVIKAKDFQDFVIIKKQLKKLKSKNINVTFTREIIKILSNALVAINFNSLSVIDCLLCKIPVIIINPIKCDQKKLMFTEKEDSNILYFISKDKNLETVFKEIISTKYDFNKLEVIKFVNKFIDFDLKLTSAIKVESVLMDSLNNND